jgi:alkanesulfonate monooxygenase SsuD/methylene tetrahydromethanopterin reductase-like flavin-dependent oxidoreductase (luciferase family)
MSWRDAAPLWRSAEAYGLDHAWVYDHLAWRGVEPWYDAYVTLAAAAQVTSRIGLGPMVTTPNFRHPVPTAKALLALDDMAAGRLCPGVGAGSLSNDAGALGDAAWTPAERAERFVEWVTLLDLLLRQPVTTHRGRYYAAQDAATGGREPRIPLAIAATGPRGIALVARHGRTWIAQDKPDARGDGYDAVRRQLALLEAECSAIGRDPRTLDKLLLTGNGDAQPLTSVDDFERCAECYRDLGFTDLVVHWPPAGAVGTAGLDVLERIAARFT